MLELFATVMMSDLSFVILKRHLGVRAYDGGLPLGQFKLSRRWHQLSGLTLENQQIIAKCFQRQQFKAFTAASFLQRGDAGLDAFKEIVAALNSIF